MPGLKQFATDAIAAAEGIARGTGPVKTGELASIKNFLFLQYEQALGTAVHATPVFEALKRAVPDARVAVACSRMMRDVLRHNSHVDHLIPTANPYAHFLATLRGLRRGWSDAPDAARCIVTASGSTRTRIALLGLFAGPGFRLGFTNAPRLYHCALDYDPALSQIDNNLRVIDALGHAHGHCEPRVFFSPTELDAAQRLRAEQGLDDSKPCTVLVTQVSGGQHTRWREERFVAVAEHLRARGHQILFVGTLGEVPDIERLRVRLGGSSFSLAGKTDIPTLSAVLCLADLAVTLDTGTMHVGRAAGLPMAIIAPALKRAIEWLPLGQERCAILRGPDISIMPKNYRIDEVSAEHAIAAADRLLAKFPPSPEARRERIRLNLAEARPKAQR